MAAVTELIGADVTADWSTMIIWESNLFAQSGNDITAECFDDTVYAGQLIINDTTPDSVILTVVAGEGHDGTAGTGVEITNAADGTVVTLDIACEFGDIEVNGGGFNETGIRFTFGGTAADCRAQRMIVHNVASNGAAVTVMGVKNDGGNDGVVLDSFIYDIKADNGASASKRAIGVGNLSGGVTVTNLFNVTVHDVERTNNTVDAFGIWENNGTVFAENSIVTDTAGTGTVEDFHSAVGQGNGANASSDSTATGAGSKTSQSSSTIYVSTAPVDLKLAASLGPANDLGTTPTGVQFDIIGRDRDTLDDTWDMGAHQFVVVGGGAQVWPSPVKQMAHLLNR